MLENQLKDWLDRVAERRKPDDELSDRNGDGRSSDELAAGNGDRRGAADRRVSSGKAPDCEERRSKERRSGADRRRSRKLVSTMGVSEVEEELGSIQAIRSEIIAERLELIARAYKELVKGKIVPQGIQQSANETERHWHRRLKAALEYEAEKQVAAAHHDIITRSTSLMQRELSLKRRGRALQQQDRRIQPSSQSREERRQAGGEQRKERAAKLGTLRKFFHSLGMKSWFMNDNQRAATLYRGKSTDEQGAMDGKIERLLDVTEIYVPRPLDRKNLTALARVRGEISSKISSAVSGFLKRIGLGEKELGTPGFMRGGSMSEAERRREEGRAPFDWFDEEKWEADKARFKNEQAWAALEALRANYKETMSLAKTTAPLEARVQAGASPELVRILTQAAMLPKKEPAASASATVAASQDAPHEEIKAPATGRAEEPSGLQPRNEISEALAALPPYIREHPYSSHASTFGAVMNLQQFDRVVTSTGTTPEEATEMLDRLVRHEITFFNAQKELRMIKRVAMSQSPIQEVSTEAAADHEQVRADLLQQVKRLQAEWLALPEYIKTHNSFAYVGPRLEALKADIQVSTGLLELEKKISGSSNMITGLQQLAHVVTENNLLPAQVTPILDSLGRRTFRFQEALGLLRQCRRSVQSTPAAINEEKADVYLLGILHGARTEAARHSSVSAFRPLPSTPRSTPPIQEQEQISIPAPATATHEMPAADVSGGAAFQMRRSTGYAGQPEPQPSLARQVIIPASDSDDENLDLDIEIDSDDVAGSARQSDFTDEQTPVTPTSEAVLEALAQAAEEEPQPIVIKLEEEEASDAERLVSAPIALYIPAVDGEAVAREEFAGAASLSAETRPTEPLSPDLKPMSGGNDIPELASVLEPENPPVVPQLNEDRFADRYELAHPEPMIGRQGRIVLRIIAAIYAAIGGVRLEHDLNNAMREGQSAAIVRRAMQDTVKNQSLMALIDSIGDDPLASQIIPASPPPNRIVEACFPDGAAPVTGKDWMERVGSPLPHADAKRGPFYRDLGATSFGNYDNLADALPNPENYGLGFKPFAATYDIMPIGEDGKHHYRGLSKDTVSGRLVAYFQKAFKGEQDPRVRAEKIRHARDRSLEILKQASLRLDDLAPRSQMHFTPTEDGGLEFSATARDGSPIQARIL